MTRTKKRAAFIIFLIALIIIIGAFLIILGINMFRDKDEDTPVSGNELKIPTLLQDLNPDPLVTDYELKAMEGQSEFIEGKKTDTYGYNGNYLGPVLKLRTGEEVNIKVSNSLRDTTTMHWHGLVVDGEDDGGPHQGILPGETWTPNFIVDQPAATLWFHPHLMGNTADQVYQGLSGLIYVEDELSDSLMIPKDYGIDDIPLIVQDRNFRADGSFDYSVSMMGTVPGNTILVNGTPSPYFNVMDGKVRFRILNASNSENFVFTLSDGGEFNQIASDGGFLSAPFQRKSLFLAPAERAEVIVDFSKSNGTVFLMAGKTEILELRLADVLRDSGEIPQALAKIEEIPLGNSPRERTFIMQNMGITGTINGKYFDIDRIDEEVQQNETEVWTIINQGGMMQSSGHPFHVHGTQFQVISRNGEKPTAEESGFKDTVFVDNGEEVRIKVRFSHVGIYMYHCHILEHEDNGMMGQFSVE